MEFPDWINRAAKTGNFFKGGTDPVQLERMRKQAEETKRKEAEKKQKEREKSNKILEAKQQKLKPEPPAGEDVITIQVNLPGGRRTRRRFLKTDSVSDVITFAKAFDIALGNSNYVLQSRMPKKSYTNMRQSLSEAGMNRQENLFVVQA
jgi:ssRNA-specific RNase YbeY (16S rRNA maturation enzyme)